MAILGGRRQCGAWRCKAREVLPSRQFDQLSRISTGTGSTQQSRLAYPASWRELNIASNKSTCRSTPFDGLLSLSGNWRDESRLAKFRSRRACIAVRDRVEDKSFPWLPVSCARRRT